MGRDYFKLASFDTSLEKVKVFDKGVHFKDPETFGEYQLSYRAGDIVSPKVDSYEPLGAESRPTYYHQRQRARPFHIDFCFLSDDLPKPVTATNGGHDLPGMLTHRQHAAVGLQQPLQPARGGG